MFSIFTHVMKPVGDTNSEPGLTVVKEDKLSKISLARRYVIVDSHESRSCRRAVCDIFKGQFVLPI